MDLNRNQRNSLRVLGGLVLLLIFVTSIMLLSKSEVGEFPLGDILCAAAVSYGVGYLMRATEDER